MDLQGENGHSEKTRWQRSQTSTTVDTARPQKKKRPKNECKFWINSDTCIHCSQELDPGNRDVATGAISGIYTLLKSVQVNFLWGNNEFRAVIVLKFYTSPKNFYTFPKQISGYAPAREEHSLAVFTARRYALCGLSYRNSVRLSARLSVRLSHSWTVST